MTAFPDCQTYTRSPRRIPNGSNTSSGQLAEIVRCLLSRGGIRIFGVMVSAAFFVLSSRSVLQGSAINKQKFIYIIVLGLQPNADGSLRPPLKARINTAKKVYQDYYHNRHNGTVKLVVTGADVAKLGFTEAHAMAMALEMNGDIPKHDILLEEKAVDTIENAIYTLDLVLQSSSKTMPHQSKSSTRLILVTSAFHMPRSWFIFESVLRHYQLTKSLDAEWESTVASPNHWTIRNNMTLLDRLTFERDLLRDKMIPMLENNYGIPTKEAVYQKALKELEGMISQENVNAY